VLFRSWRRTPTQLAADFPGSRGAIYGAASNDRFAAFKRPPNRVSGVPGLYLASGSAHPGGGLPMVALSGLAAADCLSDDLGVGDLSASVSR
jgi:phytoene dehydrogenase-like protein